MKTETLEAIGAASNKVTLAAAASTMWAWVTSNEFAALLAGILGIATLLVGWYYKREANKRQAAESELRQQERHLRMALMQATGQPIAPPEESDLIPLGSDD